MPPENGPFGSEAEDGEDSLLPDRIANTFAGKCLLVTGATGFMGKVLVEKLLRSCPDVDTVYFLVRSKKGKQPQLRVDELFQSPLFATLSPETRSKVRAIEGDILVANPPLGINDTDKAELQSRVNIIYHCAATIRFDEPLKRAVLLNTRGTKLILELAHTCRNLDLFVHVSTAYCHLREKVLLEKTYDPPADPHNVIKCVEWMDEDVVDTITDKLIADLPNTYAFTKALGEGLVNEQIGKLPIIIMRPSVVIPIWKEPIPGWTDNINGPTGILIGAGKGVIRTMLCDEHGYADYIPVDVAANILLGAVWNYLHNDKETHVYHLTSSSEIRVPWRDVITIGRKIIENKIPLNGVVWYPGGSMKSSKLAHNISLILFHLLPALLVDTLLFILGYKPVLCKVQRRVNKGFEVFQYYANNQWEFSNTNVQSLRKKLNMREKKTYIMDGESMDREDYFTNCIHAARLYILNEPDDTIPAARRHMRVMWWVDRLTKIAFAMLFVWMMYRVFSPIIYSSSLFSSVFT